jgi:Methylmalonyl-CoA mutase, N-terminal domain/subunit
MDEALWLPTEKSVQVALRTQQIIAYESGAADSIDPMAGSYLVEYLTDQIEQKAVDYIRKIDEMGGALKAIENGYMQNEIQDSAFATQRRLEKGEEVVVGVNKFQAQEEIELESLKIDPAIETNQREKLALLRQNRDPEKVAELLSHLESAAKSDENLMPLFIECVENKLTLGEICGLLRQVWGEYRAPNFI